ncbi:hydratase [Lachnospiraceae bacterium MD1]|uniref:Hydratase n=1 Tax=Variimorphobacter saccharofermentans TaxID=2755051 RepID=A0A839K213_9FIRM|nr:hydratase [Variimorphobacter saccharofermentans]MBB2183039.1 hydratase [Variimorphobacter saccharofermentans]
MVKLYDKGAYLVNGTELIEEHSQVNEEIKAKTGLDAISKEPAKKNTMAYQILNNHNTSGNDSKLKIKFDKLTSHDITFVGIIQTARASGLEKFPVPYVLTNCHNSLCAVGGTINEDDHMFGLSCAKKYGGVFVPPHQAVIHQYAREMLASCGSMILGSDSHTRYGALGTMAIGEGGPELVKQLLNRTYDINMPEVIAVYLTGTPRKGVGPQDVALAIIGAVFANGYVNNKVMEFVGDGIKNLSVDYRIGIDVMTTETTCLSSIWATDSAVKEFYETHHRAADYKELKPGQAAYYDGVVYVDLSEIKPMIAMPFHPSNVYTIDELNANLYDILTEVEKKALVSLDNNKVKYSLKDKIRNGKLYVDQGTIAGCAGGGFENICDAADILNGKYIGADEFSLSVYPASQPVFMELVKNGAVTKLMASGATIRTAFCGPCFGAGDVPSNNGFSIRHTTRNFPNREGSKITNGQIASVALMDARSIAATAANKGYLTSAENIDVTFSKPKYFFDSTIYDNRVYNGIGKADSSVEIKFGPGIVDWPAMSELSDDIILKVVSEIHDPVTTTDELIPSGETSSYRSNPLGLAEFTLSRKDPAYVGRAKEVQKAEKARLAGEDVVAVNMELKEVYDKIAAKFSFDANKTQIGSTIYAVKPGDGSAREQAASCQKVLGGFANIAKEYATKRYRSNLINWGMLPFLYKDAELPFQNGDYIFIKDIKMAIIDKSTDIKAYVVTKDMKEFSLQLGELTDDEREIILKGCLINYYRG